MSPPVESTAETPIVTALPVAAFARVIGTQFVYGLGFGIFGILPSVVVRHQRGDAHDVGVTTAAIAFGALGLAPFAGLALDRFGRASMLRLGCAISSVAALGVAMALDARPVMLPLLAILGGAFVLVFNGTSAIVADLAPPGQVARAVGLQGAANMIAQAVAPTLAEATGPVFGWHVPIIAASVLMGLAAVLATFLPDAEPEPGARRVDLAFARGAARALVPLLVVSVLAGSGYASIFTFQQPHVLAQGATSVRGYFFGFSAGALLMRVGFGGLPDRFGFERTTLAALVGYALVAASFAWVTPATLGLAGFGHGIAHGVFYPAFTALAFARVDARARGIAASLVHGTFNGGHAVASILLGRLADATSTTPVFLVGAVLAAAATLVLGVDVRRQRGTSTV